MEINTMKYRITIHWVQHFFKDVIYETEAETPEKAAAAVRKYCDDPHENGHNVRLVDDCEEEAEYPEPCWEVTPAPND